MRGNRGDYFQKIECQCCLMMEALDSEILNANQLRIAAKRRSAASIILIYLSKHFLID